MNDREEVWIGIGRRLGKAESAQSRAERFVESELTSIHDRVDRLETNLVLAGALLIGCAIVAGLELTGWFAVLVVTGVVAVIFGWHAAVSAKSEEMRRLRFNSLLLGDDADTTLGCLRSAERNSLRHSDADTP